MSMNKSEIERVQATISKSLHEHWTLFLVEGAILLVLGLVAVMVPMVATVAVEIIVGWLILVSGIVGLVTTFYMRRAPGFWWSLFSALIGTVAGVVLLLWPLNGALSLTLILTAFLAFEGIVSIMFALDHRRELSGRWGMMLLSGIVDLILAGFIFSGLPGTAAWAIGLLVGINLVFGGSAVIAMALHARARQSNHA
jgi:uncharacterized membrane protein HdeD (DUF308 family)